MPKVDITFPASSAPGMRPQESGGRLVNAFVERTPVGAPSETIIRRSPGLQQVAQTFSHTHTRGFLDCSSVALWILNERVYSVSNAFGLVDLGALTGTLPVTTARNNNATPQNVVVTENGCFNLFTGSAPTAFADPDLPGSPTSVCDFEGYFIWSYGDGRIFASDLNSVSVSSLSFNTEQGLFVRRVVRYAGRVFAFGDKWTGVYRNAATSPFPLGREVTIPRGIAGTHAIAGWETGWSNELIWVGDDFVVYKLQGYTPVPVSTDDVSRDIRECVLEHSGSVLEASVYMYGKNAFWTLTCPEEWTWEFNLATGEWHERQSYNRLDWKGRRSLRMFNQWLMGDAATGELFKVSGDYFLDGLDPLIWEVESGVVSGFPMRQSIPRASFHITSGIGELPVTDDPKVAISWSLDGGHSYGDPVLRAMGGPGQTKSYPYILSSGISRGQGVRYRLRVSDPVHVGLSGGVVETEPRGDAG